MYCDDIDATCIQNSDKYYKGRQLHVITAEA
jgi:hypothetical protein